MLAMKAPMGWNSWNTFGKDISEQLIMEMADTIVEKGYRDAGYEYVIIDDCWSLKERVDGKLVADPALFPHGMKYLSDYVHSRGLKFGMYSCAGFMTCAGYPSSYGHEFEDAKQFAEWGVDYLKYDFCNFPSSGNGKNAYLTMAMALRASGREILLAACNWGWRTLPAGCVPEGRTATAPQGTSSMCPEAIRIYLKVRWKTSRIMAPAAIMTWIC